MIPVKLERVCSKTWKLFVDDLQILIQKKLTKENFSDGPWYLTVRKSDAVLEVPSTIELGKALAKILSWENDNVLEFLNLFTKEKETEWISK